MNVSLQLKSLRERAGLGITETARYMGWSEGRYRRYENPEIFKKQFLPMDLAIRLADIFGRKGIGREEVLALAGPLSEITPPNEEQNQKPIPIYRVSPLTVDGYFELFPDDIIFTLPRHSILHISGKAYGFFIYDESMHPVWRPGAYAIVDPARPPIVDHDVLIKLRGSKERPFPHYVLRRYMGREQGKITFQRLNPFQELEFAETEIEALHYVLELHEVLRP